MVNNIVYPLCRPTTSRNWWHAELDHLVATSHSITLGGSMGVETVAKTIQRIDYQTLVRFLEVVMAV